MYKKEKIKPVKKRKLITFVSDKFENYQSAWNKLFRYVTKLTFGVPIACKKYGLDHNNNPIERYNGSLKDRLKTMRGGFHSFERAEAFMNMKRTLHNFVNPHRSLRGKTPAVAAGIVLPLKNNKLLHLIKQAARNHITKR